MLSTILLSCTASLCAPVASQGGPVTITLPLEAHVRGTEIELREVARLEGDAAVVATLAGIELGAAPDPGYSRILRVGQIRASLTRRAPSISIRFQGQRATRIWPDVQKIRSETILAAAREELTRKLGQSASKLTPLSAPQDVEVPAASADPVLRARVEAESGGTTTVGVDVLIDAGIYRTVWTRWHFERMVTVPVLVRDVAAGQVFKSADFRLEERSVAGAVPAAMSPSALNGATAVRALEAGSFVRRSDVRRSFAVRMGANLTLTVRKGAIEARVPAIALEAAAIGSRLRIRLVSSEQELTATLVSADLATIELGN